VSASDRDYPWALLASALLHVPIGAACIKAVQADRPLAKAEWAAAIRPCPQAGNWAPMTASPTHSGLPAARFPAAPAPDAGQGPRPLPPQLPRIGQAVEHPRADQAARRALP